MDALCSWSAVTAYLQKRLFLIRPVVACQADTASLILSITMPVHWDATACQLKKCYWSRFYLEN